MKSSVNRKWKYKINLEPGERWLYDSAGGVCLLTAKAGNDYKIENVA